MYEPEELLEQYRSFWVTEEVYAILRHEKRKQKISMAKIVCNLVLKEYGHQKSPRKEKNPPVYERI